MAQLAGKVAVVTGGTSGIGAGTVRPLRADGAEVVFTGSNAPAAEARCAETGASFVAQRVEDAAGWPDVMAAVAARHGRLDIAFANAGTERGDGSIEEIDIADWEALSGIPHRRGRITLNPSRRS